MPSTESEFDDESTYCLMYVGRSTFQIDQTCGNRLERLGDEGFDVHVLAAEDGGRDALEERGIDVRPLPITHGPGRVASLAASFVIMQSYFIEHEPLLVHGTGGVLAWVTAVAADRVDTPGIFATVEDHVWDPEGLDLGETRARLWAPGRIQELEESLGEFLSGTMERGVAAMYRSLGELCDKYLVSNESDYRQLRERDLVPAPKLEYQAGGDGVDLDSFDPESDEFPSVDEAREELGVPEDWDRVLGYRGPIRADRDGLGLLDIIDAVASARPGVGWFISPERRADEGMVERLRRRAERGQLRVVPAKDRPRYFRTLDLYVEPRRRPGHSPQVKEAAAMSVPSVATRTPATAEAIEDGETGWLVDTASSDAVADQVVRISGAPKMLKNAGIRARARARERFNARYIDEQILRLYDSVLSERLASPGESKPVDSPDMNQQSDD